MEQKIQDYILKPSWIIDGNFLNKATSRFTECDTIYFLDINRFVCLFSVINRYFKFKGKKRDSRSDLCDEKITKDYLKWVFSGFYKTSRKRIYDFIRQNPNKKVIIFNSRRQINKYIKEELSWK